MAAGAVAGVFGVGGGIIFVPTLTLVLGLGQLEAEATSLLAIIPVAILGSWRQTRTGHVNWRAATVMGLVSVVTAIGGALIADVAPERLLRVGLRDPAGRDGDSADPPHAGDVPYSGRGIVRIL